MRTIVLNATDARNQFFPLLEQVSRGEVKVVVKKQDTKAEVVISKKVKEKSWSEIVKKTYGSLRAVAKSDFYDSSEDRGRREFLQKLRSK